jgi:hypothetical protein
MVAAGRPNLRLNTRLSRQFFSTSGEGSRQRSISYDPSRSSTGTARARKGRLRISDKRLNLLVRVPQQRVPPPQKANAAQLGRGAAPRDTTIQEKLSAFVLGRARASCKLEVRDEADPRHRGHSHQALGSVDWCTEKRNLWKATQQFLRAGVMPL